MRAVNLRGHKIEPVDGQWVYSDNGEPTVGNRRPCGHCKKPDRKDGHDACLGHLPGVMNACCGHGTDGSYIQFNNGSTVRGFYVDAMEHEDSERCWCEPVLDYVDPESGIKVWIHKESH